MRQRCTKAFGPYPNRNGWRVVVVGADGTRSAKCFADENEARAVVAALRDATSTRTVGQAVTDYLADRRERGLAESSAVTTRHRLMALLRLTDGDRQLSKLTPAIARQLYARRTAEVAVDTHRGEVACAGAWGAFCVAQGWLRLNPFDGVQPTGRRSRGKAQLRVDEARRLLATVTADQSPEATAVLMALTMGLRAHEIVERTARDLDDGGRLLWISKSKTRAGVRQLAIPTALRPRLAALAEGMQPDDRIFGAMTRHMLHYHVVRFAELAGVPRVTPHGLRGTFATLAVTGGSAAAALAPQFGHNDDGATMRRHYLAPGAEETANAARVERVLAAPEETATTEDTWN